MLVPYSNMEESFIFLDSNQWLRKGRKTRSATKEDELRLSSSMALLGNFYISNNLMDSSTEL